MIMGAPACIAAPQGDAGLPAGVKAVWDLTRAHREATRTRERISINGLWRWQPAANEDAIPAGSWGYLRVPETWPGGAREWGKTTFFPHSDWAARKDLGSVTSAWQEREVTVPREWSGRRITLVAPYLNSYAAVYVDGKKAGEMRYPAGELDLTASCRAGQTHTLSMLVMALPLKGVMLSFSDTASAKQVAGKVARRGVCGDMWLTGTPAAARIVDVKVETSVRRWQITFEAALAGLDAQAKYRLRAVIQDGGSEVERFTSRPFGAADLAGGRFAITEHWRPERLWDTDTPHQYNLRVELVNAELHRAGRGAARALRLPRVLDRRPRLLPERHAHLSFGGAAGQCDSSASPPASYEGTRATLQRFKSFGINFVYTHNYGCEPASHLSFEEVLRAADDEGMLVAFSQPHFGHYDWNAPDADGGQRLRAARGVLCARGAEPSVGGLLLDEPQRHRLQRGHEPGHDRRHPESARSVGAAQRRRRRCGPKRSSASSTPAASSITTRRAIWARCTPSISTPTGSPIQEMSDWFEHWATIGVKPVFTCEYSVPFIWDWAMYRGWYKGKREFGSAPVPWEFCVAEWDAQFLGDRAYEISEAEKANLRWEAEQFRKGRVWHALGLPAKPQFAGLRRSLPGGGAASDGQLARLPHLGRLGELALGVRQLLEADGATNAIRAISALAIDWDHLQQPGPRPAYVQEQQAKDKLAFRRSAAEPTAAAQALYRNNMPLLAYIGGKPAAFTSKDHNFLPGETVEKQLIVDQQFAAAGGRGMRVVARLPLPAVRGFRCRPASRSAFR